jgi:CRISPR-associated protein Cas1
MASLYLTEQGAILRKAGNCLVVEKNNVQLLEVEIQRLDTVVLFGNIHFTTQAARLLLENGIEMALLSESGHLFGQLTPPTGKNIVLRQKQFLLFSNSGVCLDQSKLLVEAKIQNSLSVLKQFTWNEKDLDLNREMADLGKAMDEIAPAPDAGVLNGIEGNAAKIYFGGFGKVFREPFLFNGRSKRPPLDPANALMSFGYVLLGSLIQAHLDAVGFDPFMGFYHDLSYGRPSLALDLLEVFRAPIIDRFVVKCFNLKIFKADDFSQSETDGFRLSPPALKRFFTRWNEHLRQQDFGGILQEQIESLRKFCMAETELPVYYRFRAQ